MDVYYIIKLTHVYTYIVHRAADEVVYKSPGICNINTTSNKV